LIFIEINILIISSSAKKSSNYDKARESYMVDRINKLMASRKNVILPIGSSHVYGLREQLEGCIVLSDKSKVAKSPKAMINNIRETLQKASRSSFIKLDSVPQNKKHIQQTR
jgi:hypothetical protein